MGVYVVMVAMPGPSPTPPGAATCTDMAAPGGDRDQGAGLVVIARAGQARPSASVLLGRTAPPSHCPTRPSQPALCLHTLLTAAGNLSHAHPAEPAAGDFLVSLACPQRRGPAARTTPKPSQVELTQATKHPSRGRPPALSSPGQPSPPQGPRIPGPAGLAV